MWFKVLLVLKYHCCVVSPWRQCGWYSDSLDYRRVLWGHYTVLLLGFKFLKDFMFVCCWGICSMRKYSFSDRSEDTGDEKVAKLQARGLQQAVWIRLFPLNMQSFLMKVDSFPDASAKFFMVLLRRSGLLHLEVRGMPKRAVTHRRVFR